MGASVHTFVWVFPQAMSLLSAVAVCCAGAAASHGACDGGGEERVPPGCREEEDEVMRHLFTIRPNDSEAVDMNVCTFVVTCIYMYFT